MNNTGLTNC